MVKRKTLLVWGLWTGRLAVSGATLGWMGFIFYLSSLSQAEASQPLESPVISWLGVLRSYAAHIVLYGVLAALAQASIWGWKPDYRFRWVLAATIFAAVYGISDEYHQSLVGLSGSIADAAVNTIGASGAATSLWMIRSWLRSPTRKITRLLRYQRTGNR